MPGKHRKTSRPAAIVAMVVAPAGLAAATMAVTSMPTAVPPDTTVAAPSVGLRALITPANSTSQFFAGTTYYGRDYTNPPTYGPQQTVPFLSGPQGIATAIHDANNDPKGIVVLASGWGAGQTGTALGQLKADNDPALNDIKLVILDNNTNRAGGGFWTTYAPFAPLLATSAAPTPSNTGVPVLDVAYEYNINSDAPVDPLNPFALGNSLAAYAYGYGAQSTAVIPNGVMAEAQNPAANPADPANAVHYHYVLRPDGTQISKTPLPQGTTTTYVTIDSGDLPLTRPLRLLPGGDILADAIDPTMTELVNAGYNDGKGIPGDEAIPKDPTVTRPMQPGSSIGALGDVPGTVPIGVSKGVGTAQDDLSDPTNLVVKPLHEAGNLPLISGGLPSLPGLSATGGNLFSPANKSGTTASTGGTNAIKNFTDKVSDTVKKVTGGLTGAKPAAKAADSGS